MLLEADTDRAEQIAADLTEALSQITVDGEDLSDVMMGVLIFFNIMYDFTSRELGLLDQEVH